MQPSALLARLLVFSLMITLLPPPVVLAQATLVIEQQRMTPTQADTALWTRWHAMQYALAEDAQTIWIGGAGGVVRWDKSSKTHQRYTAVDGLPHQNVYAVALDGDGNRWFGGDGGLSRLDAANRWSHFTTANSGLHSNRVDGIAVGADNTLWVSHGLPTGGVSRREPDGSWRWFPSRTVAVALDYARIQQTRNVNPLWTVVGAEVWVGYAVYNGVAWLDRTPANVTGEPKVVAVDSQGSVWVLGDAHHIFTWRGASWSVRDVQQSVPSFYQLTTLAVGPDDSVWVGWDVGPGPFSSQDAGFGRLQDQSIFQSLQRPTPLAALLPTTAGLWAVGPGWLRQADGVLSDFPDIPIYANVADALLDGAGGLWLASQGPGLTRDDRLQTLTDQGTARLDDDRWLLADLPGQQSNSAIDRFTTFARAPGGDLWTAWVGYVRAPVEGYLLQRHQGQWLKHPLPQPFMTVTDLFVQDDQRLWIAYANPISGGYGVWALNLRGTPLDQSDDTWTDYPITLAAEESGGVVAVDAGGRLWFGSSQQLYRYANGQWQAQRDGAICELAPTSDGRLFAQGPGYGANFSETSCAYRSEWVLPIEPGMSDVIRIDAFVENNLALVRSAPAQHRIWTVAPDGAVWYTIPTYNPSSKVVVELHRRSATDLTIYPLAFASREVRRLAVDANNHVWLVTDAGLWRLTARPDFSLVVHPTTWLLTPGASRQGRIVIADQGGFPDTVTLQLRGLPNDVTAQIDPTEVQPGRAVTVTLTANASAALGTTPVTLIGVSNQITHTAPLTITVVAELFSSYLPVGDQR